jgi:hypothetical protein
MSDVDHLAVSAVLPLLSMVGIWRICTPLADSTFRHSVESLRVRAIAAILVLIQATPT